MKMLLKILLIAIISPSTLLAMRPVTTYTFVDPCMRFVSVTSVQATHNCYSFFVNNVQAGDQDTYYTWNFGDGQSAHGTSLYHCYADSLAAGQHTVTMAYNSPACGAYPAYPVYTATTSPSTATNCSSDPSVTLSASSITICCLYNGPTIPEFQYSYNYGDGIAGNQSTHTYTACGNYIITTHSYDMNMPNGGCYAYSAVNIACSIPITGINKISSESRIGLFPNPAGDQLHIVAGGAIKNAFISDLSGRCLQHADLNKPGNEPAVIGLKDLLPGVYFLYFRMEDGSQQNIKFMKE